MFKKIIKKFVPRSILDFSIIRARRVIAFTDKVTMPPKQRAILREIDGDALAFHRNKTPSSDCYPFVVHNPASLNGVPSNFGEFYLVGRNWKENSELPILLAFGFNDWKLGFVVEYLKEYRVAFAPRSSTPRFIASKFKSLKKDIEGVVVWGVTEPPSFERIVRAQNLSFYRMEDGFIRSAALGASHSTPYSLVVDGKGLYYDHSKPSDLEDVLNNYDFEADPEMLEASRESRDFVVANKISKYNLLAQVDLGDNFAFKKNRKRVLVIGQVDGDAAVRRGNPDGWRMTDVVRLARIENPEAEVLYRPHPDTYHGYQKSSFSSWKIDKIAKLVDPKEPLMDLLETVDKLYTISSLSGLEAVVRKIPVVTVGTPFYGGWGLTDDRAKFDRRDRPLTLDELFAAVYLIYPKYLVNTDDPAAAIRATCLRIMSDRDVALFTSAEPRLISHPTTDFQKLTALAKSDLWPRLLLDDGVKNKYSEAERLKAIRTIPLTDILRRNCHSRYHLALACLFVGEMKRDADIQRVIKAIRPVMDEQGFAILIEKLARFRPEIRTSHDYASLKAEQKAVVSASAYLEDKISVLEDFANFMGQLGAARPGGDLSQLYAAPKSGGETTLGTDPFKENIAQVFLSEAGGRVRGDDDHFAIMGDLRSGDLDLNSAETRTKLVALLNSLLETQLEECLYDDAQETLLDLLLLGHSSAQLMMSFANIATIKFDNPSAFSLSELVLCLYQPKINHKAIVAMFEAMGAADYTVISNYMNMRPEKVVNVELLQVNEADEARFEQFRNDLFLSLSCNKDYSIPKVQSHLALMQTKQALETVEAMIEDDAVAQSPQLAVAYSTVLSVTGQLEYALTIMVDTLKSHKTTLVFREAMRICVLLGDYSKGMELLTAAKKNRIDLGDMMPRKMYFGARMPGEALYTFRDVPLKKEIERHYKSSYNSDLLTNASDRKKILGLPIYGPGDEIRFASIYPEFVSSLPDSQISIGCEPRLQSLFARSFGAIDMVPIERKSRGRDEFDVSNYDKLASSLLKGALDNHAVQQIEDCDEFCLVTDQLGQLRPDYESFPGKPYLMADQAKVAEITARLPRGKPLVGISWRSSLNTASRNEHYLSVEELAPIFALDGVQFVNVQYDDCDEELAWVEKHFPGKIIDLEDIDQYNDFDTVAALLRSLDLVVSTATTVVELSGALGCPTWLLSNSSELHWRKLDGGTTDVWHNSIQHIEGAILKDKESLVCALEQELKNFLEKRQQQAVEMA